MRGFNKKVKNTKRNDKLIQKKEVKRHNKIEVYQEYCYTIYCVKTLDKNIINRSEGKYREKSENVYINSSNRSNGFIIYWM